MARRIEKYHEMSETELQHQERELHEQVFRLRFGMVTGQGEGLKRLREVRRDLARVKTLLRKREIEAARKS